MRLHRFYTTEEMQKGQQVRLSDRDQVHQMKSVFRFHPGSRVILFNGDGHDYECEIVSLDRDECSLKVVEQTPTSFRPRVKLTLAVSMIKKDNMEWIIQKATELGAAEVVPVISERSEKKGFNMERARRIIIEATEQSGRNELVRVSEPVALEDWLENAEGCIVAFHTTGELFARPEFEKAAEITVLIGPEGGWTDAEISSFRKKGFSVKRLETPVLRAETAAIAAASLFLA